jgi:hypothetical protein
MLKINDKQCFRMQRFIENRRFMQQKDRAEAYMDTQARKDEEWASWMLQGHRENQIGHYRREEREHKARFARAVNASALEDGRTKVLLKTSITFNFTLSSE